MHPRSFQNVHFLLGNPPVVTSGRVVAMVGLEVYVHVEGHGGMFLLRTALRATRAEAEQLLAAQVIPLAAKG